MICINAIQLTLALLSNLFLYLNMTRRIRFSVAQAIAITGWYIHAYLMIDMYLG